MGAGILGRRGFTLLELIAVMMILGLLAALAVPLYMDLEESATSRMIDAAVSELNGREGLVWSHVKTSDSSYHFLTGDDDVWDLMRNDPTKNFPDLGAGYNWVSGPTQSGGTLNFNGTADFDLSCNASTIARPAIWIRKP
jgi:prepilin-type N-terminal cleavage/methylation domain-containing protein